MANNRQVDADQLKEGTTILVNGLVSYSRVISLIDGEERERRNQKRKHKILYPYTNLSISNATVQPVSQDPNNLTLEELFVQERRYASKKEDNQGKGLFYSIDNKSKNLPLIWTPGENGYVQVEKPEGELAVGLNVTLVLETYKPRDNENRGIALRHILVNEPIRYQTGFDTDALASRGIVFATPPKQMVGEAPAPADDSGTHIDPGTGLPMPAPGSQQYNQAPQAPAQQQYAQPAPQQPQQPAPQQYAQPNQQPAPQYNQAPQQPQPQVQPQQQFQAPPAPQQAGPGYGQPQYNQPPVVNQPPAQQPPAHQQGQPQAPQQNAPSAFEQAPVQQQGAPAQDNQSPWNTDPNNAPGITYPGA